MHLSLTNRILGAAALVTLVACGGSGSDVTAKTDTWKNYPLHLVNNAGAQASFSFHNGGGGIYTQVVPAGSFRDVTGQGQFVKDAENGTFFASVVGNGGEQDSGTVPITQTGTKSITATWNDVNISIVAK